MGINYNSIIPINSLEICLDASNSKSYPGAGTSWKNLKTNTTFNGSDFATATWANNIAALTICAVVEKTGNDPGYATHPINKWNGGTGNASFVLYHFGASGGQGSFSFYYTCDSTWTGQFVTTLSVGQKAHIVFQWNSSTGGQVWLNGAKVGGRTGSGLLGVSGTSAMDVYAPTFSAYTTVHHAAFYSGELTDAEVFQHYTSLGRKFGL
jgi:hypothetical protein